MEQSQNGTTNLLGEADFDLAYYANNPDIHNDKL